MDEGHSAISHFSRSSKCLRLSSFSSPDLLKLFFIYIDAVVSGFYDSVFIEMCSHFDNLNRKKETL